MKSTGILNEFDSKETVTQAVRKYVEKYDDLSGEINDDAGRSKEYYNLATDFYLHGWGRLFHFGVTHKGETLQDSLVNHEKFLAKKIELKSGDKCLDFGCGVGGPMMNISRFSGASIVGINNAAYQIQKGKGFVNENGLQDQCSFLEADWNNIPFADLSFDKAYSIEALCHASENRERVFGEAYRLLKPGGLFGGYDWIMKEAYDSGNFRHRKIKKMIELGNGIANLTDKTEILSSLKKSGFDVVEFEDRAEQCDSSTPWYQPLKGGTLTTLRISPAGRFFIRNWLKVLQFLHLIPKGSTEVHRVLEIAADSLVQGGENNIFTPMFFFLARKPITKLS